MKTAIEMISAERKRQIAEEGYHPSHDDEYEGDGQLAMAAACYALESTRRNFHEQVSMVWPWDSSYLKPKDPITDLVRAGALIVAEIERLQRQDASIGKQ